MRKFGHGGQLCDHRELGRGVMARHITSENMRAGCQVQPIQEDEANGRASRAKGSAAVI
jgi:hypothetical protein